LICRMMVNIWPLKLCKCLSLFFFFYLPSSSFLLPPSSSSLPPPFSCFIANEGLRRPLLCGQWTISRNYLLADRISGRSSLLLPRENWFCCASHTIKCNAAIARAKAGCALIGFVCFLIKIAWRHTGLKIQPMKKCKCHVTLLWAHLDQTGSPAWSAAGRTGGAPTGRGCPCDGRRTPARAGGASERRPSLGGYLRRRGTFNVSHQMSRNHLKEDIYTLCPRVFWCWGGSSQCCFTTLVLMCIYILMHFWTILYILFYIFYIIYLFYLFIYLNLIYFILFIYGNFEARFHICI